MAATRTTLVLDRAMIRRLKAVAATEGRTLSDVTQEVLLCGMEVRRKLRSRPARRLPVFSMGDARVDIANREHLLDVLEDT